jgi:hypothetical protein
VSELMVRYNPDSMVAIYCCWEAMAAVPGK